MSDILLLVGVALAALSVLMAIVSLAADPAAARRGDHAGPGHRADVGGAMAVAAPFGVETLTGAGSGWSTARSRWRATAETPRLPRRRHPEVPAAAPAEAPAAAAAETPAETATQPIRLANPCVPDYRARFHPRGRPIWHCRVARSL
jgi:hypothetical protein